MKKGNSIKCAFPVHTPSSGEENESIMMTDVAQLLQPSERLHTSSPLQTISFISIWIIILGHTD